MIKQRITFKISEQDFLKLKSLSYFYNERPSKLASSLLTEVIEKKIENLNYQDKKDFTQLLEITWELHSVKHSKT